MKTYLKSLVNKNFLVKGEVYEANRPFGGGDFCDIKDANEITFSFAMSDFTEPSKFEIHCFKAKRLGFTPGVKFRDLTKNEIFTVSDSLKFDCFGKDTQLYIGVEDNKYGQGSARIYKDGVWTVAIPQNEINIKKQMNSFKITRDEFELLHKVSCAHWKNKILRIVEENLGFFKNECSLQYSTVKEMYNAISNDDQRIVFNGVFPSFKPFKTLDELKGKGDYFRDYKLPRAKHKPLLGVRSDGEYKDCAFALDKRFDWELKTDSLGIVILVPKEKIIDFSGSLTK